MSDDVDMEELTAKAKVISEATGRSVRDVLEDLLDDGKLNNSNRSKDAPKDLVTQLKEAAELITTVQSVSAQVSENKVLNGGNNKTAVAVETTLEGDIVDRAIASAQRKADNIKKLIATMIPVFLLLTGGSLEAFGITNFVGSEGNDGNDDYDPYYDYGGCTAPDADNYDPGASWDDGSCYWDGGGNGNDCYPDWWWQNEAIFDHDHNGQGFNNDLRVQVDFRDLNSCNEHMNNGYFEIMVGDDSRILEYNFHDEFTINEHYMDLAPGDYYVTVDYHTYDGSSWSGPTAWVTMEDEPCVADLRHKSSNLWLVSGSEDEVEVEMTLINDNDCEGRFEVMFSTYRNDTYVDTLDYPVFGYIDVQGPGESHYFWIHDTWDKLEPGEWWFETRFRPVDGSEECCWQTNKVLIKEPSQS